LRGSLPFLRSKPLVELIYSLLTYQFIRFKKSVSLQIKQIPVNTCKIAQKEKIQCSSRLLKFKSPSELFGVQHIADVPGVLFVKLHKPVQEEIVRLQNLRIVMTGTKRPISSDTAHFVPVKMWFEVVCA
jgi:hypothetical protein